MLAQLPWELAASPAADLVGLTIPQWAADAACKDLTYEEADAYFFPERGQSAAKGRELCRRCVVRAECLDQALTQPEEFGVWGGTTPRERQRGASNRRRSRHF